MTICYNFKSEKDLSSFKEKVAAALTKINYFEKNDQILQNLSNRSNSYNLLPFFTHISKILESKGKPKLVLSLLNIDNTIMHEDGKYFLAGLRTALDLNQLMISTIFTGYSKSNLNKIFNDFKKPFYHFGQQITIK